MEIWLTKKQATILIIQSNLKRAPILIIPYSKFEIIWKVAKKYGCYKKISDVIKKIRGSYDFFEESSDYIFG